MLLLSLCAGACREGGHSAAWWEAEHERTALDQELRLKEFRLARDTPAGGDSLAAVRARTEANAAALKSLRERNLRLQSEVAALAEEWPEFRSATLRQARARMAGARFNEFSTGTGRTYQDVRLASIDDAGVTLRHAEGSVRVKYQDLSPHQRLQFGLEEDLAAVATRAEIASASHYERQLETRLLEQESERRKVAEATLRRAETQRDEWRSMVSRQIEAAGNRALAQPASRTGLTSWRGWSADSSYYRSSRPRFYNVYYYQPVVPSCVSPVTSYPRRAPSVSSLLESRRDRLPVKSVP